MVTLLKGTPSLVADPEGRLLVSTQEGGSDLAVGGHGGTCLPERSVLSWPRGSALFRAAGLALHATGRAASGAELGAGLMPSDVVEAIPAVLSDEDGGDTDLPFPFVTFDQRCPGGPPGESPPHPANNASAPDRPGG